MLEPVFDRHFSEQSFGFRPGRSAHRAVRRARRDIAKGFAWAVDLDLDRFFDRVNHDALMARVARRVQDKRVLRLVRRYLDAGVMADRPSRGRRPACRVMKESVLRVDPEVVLSFAPPVTESHVAANRGDGVACER